MNLWCFLSQIFKTIEGLDLGCGVGGGRNNKDIFKVSSNTGLTKSEQKISLIYKVLSQAIGNLPHMLIHFLRDATLESCFDAFEELIGILDLKTETIGEV